MRQNSRSGKINADAILEQAWRRVYVDRIFVGRSRLWLSRGPPASAGFAFFVAREARFVVEGRGDGVSRGVETAQQLDFPLGALQEIEALLEQLNALLVAIERLGQANLALLEIVDDLFETLECFFEGWARLGH